MLEVASDASGDADLNDDPVVVVAVVVIVVVVVEESGSTVVETSAFSARLELWLPLLEEDRPAAAAWLWWWGRRLGRVITTSLTAEMGSSGLMVAEAAPSAPPSRAPGWCEQGLRDVRNPLLAPLGEPSLLFPRLIRLATEELERLHQARHGVRPVRGPRAR